MCSLLEGADFDIQEMVDRTEFAFEFFAELLATPGRGPQPLGIHLVMGQSAPQKLRNVLTNLERVQIAPVQMIARRR